MSPVARQQTTHTVRALAVAVGGVVLALGVVAIVAVLASRGTVEVRLGDDVFAAGSAERIASEIDQQGPIPYPDLAGGERDIVLQHLGDDAEDGWFAFEARPPGTPHHCMIEWHEDDQVFQLLDGGEVTEDCDGSEFPPDGEGLPQYPVSVDDGSLSIDLRSA
jgi:hypothetical protein